MSEGNQIVSILYYSPASSSVVNKRHKEVRQIGVYSGGYLFIVDASHAKLYPLVCEITDGTHQVRVETTTTVDSISVDSGAPYIVLRWTYSGAITDYMEIKTVTTPLTNDLIVGKCSFDGDGNLQGFSYSERSTPNVQNLFLRVEAPDASMITKMKVRVRAGRIHTATNVIKISDFETSSPFTHSGGGSTEYGLVYIDSSGNVQIVNASGNTTVPSFAGKMVLAIVAITKTTSEITQSMITDVRPFMTSQISPDGITIDFDASSGKLYLKSVPSALIPPVVPAKVDSVFGARTNLDSLGSILVKDVVYKATSDGVVKVRNVAAGGAVFTITGYTDSNNPPTTIGDQRQTGAIYAAAEVHGFDLQIRKNDYWKIVVSGANILISWLPIGITGKCVKQ